MLLTAILLGNSARVTVSGASIIDFAGQTQAAVQFNSDGTVDSQVNNGSLIQINDNTDWIIPNAFAPGSYEIFATQNSGDPVTGPSLDTWLPLTLNRKWELNSGGQTAELDISIRIGPTVLDTGTYTLDTT